MLRKILIWLGKVCIAGIAALGALSIYSFLFSYVGAHSVNPTGATDYVYQPYQLLSDTNEGFMWIHLDENGFNNEDGAGQKEVENLVIGSSHMFSNQVAKDQNTVSLLNTLLPEMYTYNMGMTGHRFHTCVSNLRAAVNTYHPTSYVILETETIEPTVDDMQSVLTATYPEIPIYDGWLLNLLTRYVPATRNIYNMVDNWRLPEADMSVTTVKEDYLSEEYRAILDAYLRNAAQIVTGGGTQLIIFYLPVVTIGSDGQLLFDTDLNAMNTFLDSCERNGIIFLDMTEDFQALYDQEHKLPYGFINSRVGHGHLNKYGHKVIAERLAEIIRGNNSNYQSASG